MANINSKDKGFSVVATTSVASGELDLPLGIERDELESAVQTEGPVVIVGRRGTDRLGIARQLHALVPGLVFHAVDGGLEGGDVAVTSVLEETAAVDTLFIDNFQDLGVDVQSVVVANLRSEGCRVIVGCTEQISALISRADCRLSVSPLEGRKDDVCVLATTLLARIKGAPRLTDDATRILKSWDWPGDVEELRAVMRRIAAISDSPVVTGRDIGDALASPHNYAIEIKKPLAEIEREHIMRVLDSQGWNRTRTAKMLGIDVKTLYNKLKRYEATTGQERHLAEMS